MSEEEKQEEAAQPPEPVLEGAAQGAEGSGEGAKESDAPGTGPEATEVKKETAHDTAGGVHKSEATGDVKPPENS